MWSELSKGHKIGIVGLATLGVSVLSALAYQPICRSLKRKKYHSIKKMEIDQPHAQWVLVLGDDSLLMKAFVDKLKKGKLRICKIILDQDELMKQNDYYDKLIFIDDHEELARFLRNRHIKIVFNAHPLLTEIADLNKESSWKMIRKTVQILEIVFPNMREHAAGCFISLSPPGGVSPTQFSCGEFFFSYCKALCKGTPILSQHVESKIHSEEEAILLARKSLKNIGIYDKIT